MNKPIRRMLSLALSGALLFSAAAAEESVFTREVIERGLVSVGNTERLHRAIEKARSGQQVNIVCLGGSITEGAMAQPQATACYAARSADLFAEKFMPDPAKLNCHNAGISGTPSLLGVTRCEQDVLAYAPDIVFVEFAVNDGGDDQARLAYESLVRKLLNSETQPAVVLLFTLMKEGWTAQGHMEPIGKHYDLGMISVRNAIQQELKAGRMQWSDYSPDYAHPTTEGHAFLAEMIGYYFDQAAATAPTSYAVPEKPLYGSALENLRNVRTGDECIISQGNFRFGPVSCYSYRTGWQHIAMNDPMVLRLTATHLTLAFKQEKDTACGTAEVYVDGKLMATLPSYADSAWGNVVTQLIQLDSPGPHDIEIRMQEGHAAKRFSLLDIGYAVE